MQPRPSHSLVLFFNPLFALLMLFLECVTLCFGTASNIGGNISAIESIRGIRASFHDDSGRSRVTGAFDSAGNEAVRPAALGVVPDELDGMQGRDQLGRIADQRLKVDKMDREGAASCSVAILRVCVLYEGYMYDDGPPLPTNFGQLATKTESNLSHHCQGWGKVGKDRKRVRTMIVRVHSVPSCPW